MYERLLKDLKEGRVILTNKVEDRTSGMTIGWGSSVSEISSDMEGIFLKRKSKFTGFVLVDGVES